MYTYQDFMKDAASGFCLAAGKAISEHRSSLAYRTAAEADAYDRQQNTMISNYSRMLYTANGSKIVDQTASNNRLCSAFFRRLNTQRMTYSMGNGVTFTADGVKEKLGIDCDTQLKTAVYDALIHGTSFVFFNVDHLHVFSLREFAPLWDEETGRLMAGVRFWQIAHDKPMMAVVYELDGYTKLRSESGTDMFRVVDEKRPYRFTTSKAPSDEEPEIIGFENYSSLPIVPMYGSRLKQSTLIGMKQYIDAYDLINSGFANDLQDCAQIYWMVGNAGGMDDDDLTAFLERLKLRHIAAITDADSVTVTPYTQEIPTNARKTYLDELKTRIYEDFGALDVHAVSAGSTNDHIEAAYQPMDENADELEYQVIETVQAILALIGIEDTPQFKRNRISNEKERTEMVLLAADYLDDETVLHLLPFVTPDMVAEIMERKGVEDIERFSAANVPQVTEEGSPDIGEM